MVSNNSFTDVGENSQRAARRQQSHGVGGGSTVKEERRWRRNDESNLVTRPKPSTGCDFKLPAATHPTSAGVATLTTQRWTTHFKHTRAYQNSIGSSNQVAVGSNLVIVDGRSSSHLKGARTHLARAWR